MTCELESGALTDDQKNEICTILADGGDRETAAGVVKCLVVDIGRAIETDSQFALRVRHAEASAELSHMQNILKATKDGKYWRASVWWLERRSPERFGRRSAGAITPQQLHEAIAALNDGLQRVFPTEEDQRRVNECIDKLYAAMEQLLDARCAETVLKRSVPLPRLAHQSSATANIPEKTNRVKRLKESADP
jgi:hypothetical protein